MAGKRKRATIDDVMEVLGGVVDGIGDLSNKMVRVEGKLDKVEGRLDKVEGGIVELKREVINQSLQINEVIVRLDRMESKQEMMQEHINDHEDRIVTIENKLE
jgi:chromosome segregation ATPase